jgi:hypothetical protein
MSSNLLEYYKDSQAKQPAETDERGNVRVIFDEIPIQGRESRAALFVKNSHSYPMELEPVTTDPDLRIANYPSKLEPDEVGLITFIFAPKAERITPLNAAWDFQKTIYEK